LGFEFEINGSFEKELAISLKSTHAVAPAIKNRAAPRHRVRNKL
jgi:hypothetical protein